MAAGDSIVGICNLALVTGLGQDPINALSDNRKAAILCNLRYDQIRRELLRKHPWSFAKARAQLAVAVPQPAFGDTAFTLPGDFMRVGMLDDEFNNLGWTVEGRLLLANVTAPLDLVYIYDCQDPTLFDPLFVAALGYAIAVELALPITQDRGLKAQMESALEAKMADARLVTSQDNSSSEFDVDVLLRSRN